MHKIYCKSKESMIELKNEMVNKIQLLHRMWQE